jgi:Bacteriocin-protection, YdeI or OmpD-Associated
MKATNAKPAPKLPGPLAFAMSKVARARWDALPPSHQREYAEWITSAKKPETRDRRVAEAVRMLVAGQKTPMRSNDAPATSAAPVAKKLGVKPGLTLVVLYAPDGTLGKVGLSDIAKVSGKGEVVLAFARDSSALKKVAPKAFAAVKDGGLLWIAYPKKSSGIPSDLTRDEGWAAVTQAGYRTVSLVAIDDAWSAARLRPHSG